MKISDKIFRYITLVTIFLTVFSNGARAQSDFYYPGDEFVYNFSNFTPNAPAYIKSFTLVAQRRLCFQLATQYKADFAIIPQADVASWRNGGSARVYARFSGAYGVRYITLNAGRYALVARDTSGASDNSYSVIVRYFRPSVSSPYGHDWTFLNNSSVSQNLETGSRGWWGPFTVLPQYRYLLSGVRSNNAAGVNGYVISENQLAAFRAGNTFSYYYELPSLRTGLALNLPAGRYYVVYHNTRSGIAIWNAPISWTTTLERWKY